MNPRTQRRLIDAELTERAIGFMQQHAGGAQPFFLYVPLTHLHFPTLPHPDFAGRSGVGDFADAMIEMDHRVGQLIDAVDALGMFDRKNPPAEGSEAYKTMMTRFEGHSRTAMGFVWLTGRNRRADQVNAGRAYVRLQLQATALGVGMHPMSQALQEFAEMAPHYERAHQLMLGRAAPKTVEDETVQMFCRLGYTAAPAPATPRRPLAAFIA